MDEQARAGAFREPDFAAWSPMERPVGFDAALAPLYVQTRPGGGARLAMRLAERHLNVAGTAHGGCLMAMADCALFRIARDHLEGRGVTVSLNADFLGPARAGEILEAGGEVVQAGGSLIFIRGVISTGDRSVLSFTGLIKRLRAE